MASLQVRGGREDLSRFSQTVLAQSGTLEVLGPRDWQLRWQVADRAGCSRATELRSGITLNVSAVKWERPWRMAVEHGVSPIKLVLMRGPAPRLEIDGDDDRELTDRTFSIGQIQRPVHMGFTFAEPLAGRPHEQLSLAVSHARLLELLGRPALPQLVSAALAGEGAFPSTSQALVPRLEHLFDEVLHCDAGRVSAQLYQEARALEILALVIDELDASGPRAASELSAWDRERLERARQHLLQRLDEPPSLRDLARTAGLNEAKLKAGFRTMYGSPVYAYLRDQRMQEAQRLLRTRRYNVTEVALRVGYANPSKFAAAFRRRFHIPPSGV